MNLAMAKALGEAGRITKPILILHGDADRLTSPTGSRKLDELVTSTDRTLRTWPGAYHELHHEPESEEVLQTIITWMKARL